MVRYVLRSKMSGATDDVLEESYRPTVGEMEQVPLPTLAVIKRPGYSLARIRPSETDRS
jgi:hypothetical protein